MVKICSSCATQESSLRLKQSGCQVWTDSTWKGRPTYTMHAATAAAAAVDAVDSECWDVEAEIARELQNLAAECNYDEPASPKQQPLEEPPADVDVQALWAAIAARDHLADKLTATLHEVASLPNQTVQPGGRAPTDTASPDQVTAAVAALSKVTGHDQGQNALQAAAASPVVTCTYGKQHPALVQAQAAQPVEAAAANAWTQLHPAAHILESKPPRAEPQHLQESAADVPNQVDSRPAAAAAAAAKPSTPPSPQGQAPFPARPHLSPPRTPNTQDMRQHAAVPLLPQHSEQQQLQSCAALEPSTEETSAETDVARAAAGPSVAPAHTKQPAAVAAAVTEEQAAAAEATRQQLAERGRLRQLLQQQVRQEASGCLL